MWTYEPRQGRNAATVVCSAFAVVTLAALFVNLWLAGCRRSNFFSFFFGGLSSLRGRCYDEGEESLWQIRNFD